MIWNKKDSAIKENTMHNEDDFFFGKQLNPKDKKLLLRLRRNQKGKMGYQNPNRASFSIASCSDFHLGLRNAPREFQGREEEACAFLDYLESEHDLVMVLGDFYGILENRGRVEQIRNRYPRLSERVEALNHKIYGNHDIKLKENYLHFPWQGSYVNNFRGRNFLAIHGHQFDRYNKNAEQGLGAKLVRGHTFWENRLKRNMNKLRARYRLPEQVSTIFQLIRILTFEYNIEQYSELFGIDIILSGHIHYPTVKRFPSGLIYINNGSCVDSFTYSHLIPNQNIFEIRQWNPVTSEAKTIRTLEDGRYSPWIASLVQSGLFS